LELRAYEAQELTAMVKRTKNITDGGRKVGTLNHVLVEAVVKKIDHNGKVDPDHGP
jgi:hypothetical protein